MITEHIRTLFTVPLCLFLFSAVLPCAAYAETAETEEADHVEEIFEETNEDPIELPENSSSEPQAEEENEPEFADPKENAVAKAEYSSGGQWVTVYKNSFEAAIREIYDPNVPRYVPYGKITILKDTSVSHIDMDFSSSIDLDLNGHQLKRSSESKDSIFNITKSSVLSVSDSAGNGSIVNENGLVFHARGFSASDGPAITLNSGTITGKSAGNGGAVYTESRIPGSYAEPPASPAVQMSKATTFPEIRTTSSLPDPFISHSGKHLCLPPPSESPSTIRLISA